MQSGTKPKPALFIDIDEKNPLGIIRHLKEGADLSEVFAGKTAIEYAADADKWECVQAIAKNSFTDAKDTYRYGNAIYHLIRSAIPGEVRNLLPLLIKACAKLKKDDVLNLLKFAMLYSVEYASIIVKAKKELGELDPEYMELLGATLVEVLKFYYPLGDPRKRIVEELIKLGVPLKYPNTEDKNNTPLHYAIIHKDRYLLELMLKNGSGDLAAQNTDHQTPIELAASLGLWDFVLLIAGTEKTNEADTYHYGKALFKMIEDKTGADLEHLSSTLVRGGADLTLKNGEGDEAIKLAGHLRKFEHVIAIAKAKKESGELSNELMKLLGFPLLVAIDNLRLEEARTLINIGATFAYCTQIKQYYPLHLAILNKQIDLLKLMLAKDYVNLDKQNAAHQTPIELAAAVGLWDYVIAIAEAKNTDEKDNYHYGKVLFTAMETGQPVKVIEALIKAGADLTLENDNKKTAIQYAAHEKKWEYVQAISINKKAGGKDINDGDALRLAVTCNHSETVKILLKNGANVNAWYEISTHNYCLHKAVINGNSQMITDLLSGEGAKVTVSNKDGQTPLALACALGKWECAQALTKKPCTFTDTASAGKAFLDAIKAQQLDIAKYLFESGASITEKNNDGDTALHLAIANNDTAAIEYLLSIGADQTALNKLEQTPIEFACFTNMGLCATSLLQFDKYNIDDKKRIHDLHYEQALLDALGIRNNGLAKALLENNAPCDKFSAVYGNQALRTAFYSRPLYWESYVEILDALIQHGANPYHRDINGLNFYDFLRQNEDTKTLGWLNLHYPENKLADSRSKETAEKIFKSMVENSILPKDIPVAIANLEQSLKQMLAYDLEKLKLRRYKNEKNPDLLIDTETDKLNNAVAAINSLLNFPEKEINFSYTDFEEASDIQRYLNWSKDIAKYVADIKEFLNELRLTIIRKTWYMKGFFGDWVHDYPRHVEKIMEKLNNLNTTSSTQDYLKAYAGIHKILISIQANSRRDESTQTFYETHKKKIGNVTFSTTDPAYRSYDVHYKEKTVAMVPVELLPGLTSVSTRTKEPEVVSEFASRLMPHLYPQLNAEVLPSAEPTPTPDLTTTTVSSDQALLYPDVKEKVSEVIVSPEELHYKLIPTTNELNEEPEVATTLLEDNEEKEKPLYVDVAKNADSEKLDVSGVKDTEVEVKNEETDIDAELSNLPDVLSGNRDKAKTTDLRYAIPSTMFGKVKKQEQKSEEPKKVALLA